MFWFCMHNYIEDYYQSIMYIYDFDIAFSIMIMYSKYK